MSANESEVLKQRVLVDKEGTNKLIELLKLPGSAEVIDYAVEKLKPIEKQFPELVDIFRSLQKDAELAGRHPSDIWHGEKAQTVFEQFQDGLQTEAKEALKTLLDGKPVDMLFAINEDGGFLRGYRIDGTSLNTQTQTGKSILDHLDVLFNAVLAKQGFVSKDGHIIKSDINGNVQKTASKGRDANEVIESDITQAMSSALKSIGSDWHMERREFPKQTTAPEKPAAPSTPKATPQAPASETKSPAAEEGPTPG